ncbi:acyl carrier protein [Actinomadura scrupuli]|uniref:acyl carrier protein n=1 Tax=Actinomadura scrupuli TaxID=559629 RepID=UPI003D992EE8
MTQVQQGEDVLSELVRILVDVVGEDSLAGVEVTRDTALDDDLALEGIEFVELSQRLRQVYGERVELTAFLAELDFEQLTRLTVGDLARHVESRLS